jgi:hypothetical protein
MSKSHEAAERNLNREPVQGTGRHLVRQEEEDAQTYTIHKVVNPDHHLMTITVYFEDHIIQLQT